MGKKSNVNPDHFKTAGREPQGQDVVHEVQRQRYAEAKTREKRNDTGSAAGASGHPGVPGKEGIRPPAQKMRRASSPEGKKEDK